MKNAQEITGAQSGRYGFGNRLRLWTACLVTGLWCYGQIFRDRSTAEALLFYIPAPAICGWFLLSVVLSARKRQWRRAITYLLLLALPAYTVLVVENRWYLNSAVSAERPQIRIVHWNVARGMMGWTKQLERLRSFDADIVVVSEPPDIAAATDFPGYSFDRTGNLLIAARGTQGRSGSLVPGGALKAYLVTCELPQGSVRVMMADMTSRISISRDRYLQPLMQASIQHAADLIVGDLNAPRRSIALTDERYPFEHAYHAVGSGWGYTWPVPVPMLAIDQCLFGAKIEPVSFTLSSNLLSDHRLQCFDFRLRGAGFPSASPRREQN